MADLSYFRLKIFLRDDIWKRITSLGFREASHITRSITITWSPQALLHLVVRRAIHNAAIREFYGVDPAVVLSSVGEQGKLFYRMFPTQVDTGPQKPTTLNWLLSRTGGWNSADGPARTDSSPHGGSRPTPRNPFAITGRRMVGRSIPRLPR